MNAPRQALLAAAIRPRIVEVHQPFADGVDDGLGPVEDVKLLVDIGGVVPYRLLRDLQVPRYLFVALALRESPYYLELPLGKFRGQEPRQCGSPHSKPGGGAQRD